MIRVRWTHLLRGSHRLPTALAMESVVDEFVFIVGPVLVTFLSTTGHATSGVVTAFTLAAVGACFSPPSARPSRRPRRKSTQGPLGDADPGAAGAVRRRRRGRLDPRHAGDRAGGLADQENAKSLSGVLIAGLALGSMASGIGWGAVHWRLPLRHRLAGVLVLMTVLSIPLLLITTSG